MITHDEVTDPTADDLSPEDIAKISSHATVQAYQQASLIFTEGDAADYMYFIESGAVSIFIQKFTKQEEVKKLGPGEYFGEMAFFSSDKRSASAVTIVDTTLLCVDKKTFLELLHTDIELTEKINNIVAKRRHELALKENVVDKMCIKAENLYVSIKGDPSLRESAFTRERYLSIVDRVIADLQPYLYDILINRCVYEIVVHFNSGEVHTRSIFSPLIDGIHPANKLTNRAYIDRHFISIPYQQKISLIEQIHAFLSSKRADSCHDVNPAFCPRDSSWAAMTSSRIADIISRLAVLRKIQDFYLRNITINIIEDTVRMQFNCDGAHILSSERYNDFLQRNVPNDNVESFVERRKATRRIVDVSPQVERRSPPGRRQEDWDKLILAMRREEEKEEQEEQEEQDPQAPDR